MIDNKIYTPNFTQIPNVIFDYWMARLKPTEFVILTCLCRKIFGWHKTSDTISANQLCKVTGMSKPTIINSLKQLEDLGLVIKIQSHDDFGARPNEFKLNIFLPVDELYTDNNLEELKQVRGGEKNLGGGSQNFLPGVVKIFDQGSQNFLPTKERPSKEILTKEKEEGACAPLPPSPLSFSYSNNNNSSKESVSSNDQLTKSMADNYEHNKGIKSDNRDYVAKESKKTKQQKRAEKLASQKQFADFVYMTEEEHQKLIEKYKELYPQMPNIVEDLIQTLNIQNGKNGERKFGDYLALLPHGWVLPAYFSRRIQLNNSKNLNQNESIIFKNKDLAEKLCQLITKKPEGGNIKTRSGITIKFESHKNEFCIGADPAMVHISYRENGFWDQLEKQLYRLNFNVLPIKKQLGLS